MGRKVDLLWVCMSLAIHVRRVWSDMEVRNRCNLMVGWFRRMVVGVGWIAGVMGWWVGWGMAWSRGVGDNRVMVVLWWRWVVLLLWGHFVMLLTNVLHNIFALFCESGVLLQSVK